MTSTTWTLSWTPVRYLISGSDDLYSSTCPADTSLRANALLFNGSPISQLPTTRLFAYATHFDIHPLGLEWVDDCTCVFVFETKTAAREAFRILQKTADGEEDMDGYLVAKSLPVALWPPEERVHSSLGKGDGLKGVIRMRWARHDDVKKRGAKQESQFYRKHGEMAGKELWNEQSDSGSNKRRRTDGLSDAELAAQLDKDLDDILTGDDPAEPSAPSSPPSKMRSDYIADDGRTLLERTTAPDGLASRITVPLPRRSRNDTRSRLHDRLWSEPARSPTRNKSSRRDKPSNRDSRRPRKTQQELDDELDAFLKEDD